MENIHVHWGQRQSIFHKNISETFFRNSWIDLKDNIKVNLKGGFDVETLRQLISCVTKSRRQNKLLHMWTCLLAKTPGPSLGLDLVGWTTTWSFSDGERMIINYLIDYCSINARRPVWQSFKTVFFKNLYNFNLGQNKVTLNFPA